jgi:class 3 adenylate cyclase/PAS domain-containing protein
MASDDFEKQELLLEIKRLRDEVKTLKVEKADLEIIVEMTADHSEVIETELEKQADEKVRKSEKKLAQFLEAMPVGVFVLDANGQPYYANLAAQQMFGKKIISLTTVEQLPEVCQAYLAGTEQLYPCEHLPIVRALKNESPRIDDMEIHHKDRIIPIEVLGTPIFNDEGNVAYAIAVFQDITDRKQAEAERERFTSELETVNANLEYKVAERTVQLQQKNDLIRQIFGRYLSDEIVTTLLETKSGLSLGGERREITILASDIRGFTAQANCLPPEQVLKIINLYLSTMIDVITQYQGTIDEFMGDGILVLFGAPIARNDDPERAVACAVAMQLAMNKVNKQIMKWDFAPLEMGIGVNTGEVVVGNIGSEKRTKYGVVGNEVNLTYRIESYTVGGQIFISESTLKKVSDIVKIEAEKKVKPKGIKQPISIYEVEGIGGKYNLFFHKEEDIFYQLSEEIPLLYTIVDEKHVGEQRLSGTLVKLSGKSALIRCDIDKDYFLPEPLNNLKINLFMPNQAATSDDLYAKVLSKAVDENSLYIHFTAIPTNIKAQLAALYK